MTEQEYKIFRDKYSRLKEQIKARPTGKTPEELRQIHYAITSFSPAIADIARQLTIIADAQKRLAYPMIQVDKDGMMQLVSDKPPPADDALVEAVEWIANFDPNPEHDHCCCMYMLVKKASVALAVHKKAVT